MALDKLFLTVFIMEILIKWYHDFFGFWKVNWNIFDFIIVAASLLGPSKIGKGDNILTTVLYNITLLTYYGKLSSVYSCYGHIDEHILQAYATRIKKFAL